MYKILKTKLLPQAFNITENFIDLIPRTGVYLHYNNKGYWLEIGVDDELTYNFLADQLKNILEVESEPAAVEILEYGTVTAESGLNIRANNDTESNIIGVLDYGQRIKITNKVNDWYKIELPFDGWVYGPYIQTIKTPNTINNDLLYFTESFEGFSATPYQDAGGNWTIGFGECSYKIKPNYTVTREEAGNTLMNTLNKLAAQVNAELGYLCLNQNQFNSLVDFTYNLGLESLLSSTLLKNIKLCKDNSILTNDFKMWDYCNGQQLEGLERRREAEATIFLNNTYDNN